MRDITKLANVGRGAGNRRKMLEEMRKAQQSGASSHAATPATQGSASGPLANMQAAAAAATSAAPPVLAPGAKPHAAGVAGPMQPTATPRSPVLRGTAVPAPVPGLPLQVQAIPGSVGSAKVVLQLHAIPNMPAAQSMPASQACQPQRLLPKQPSAPSTPGARLAALAAAAECWDDELTWARRCVSVPVPHTESGDSLADLLADAEFLASIDSQAAAAASSCPDTAVPARERGEGSELRGLFESFSVDELELDWAELEEGVSKLGEACGQSGVAGSSLVASNIGLPSKKGPHTLQAASLPKRCGSNGITATPLVAPGSQPTEDFEILPDVWSTGLGGAAPFEMSSSQQAPGLPPAFPMRPSSDFGPGTPLAAAGSKRPPVGGGFLSGLVRGSDAAGQLPSSQPNEGLSSPAGCSSGLCGSALPLGAQLQPSEVAEIPTEWRAILETGALLSGMHDMLS
ncbi:hypothetical protein N2152v2_000419 [Parachlorella kessleri]